MKLVGTLFIAEVMNGCICCTVRGDLAEILKGRLAERVADFDGVIIETTGMADPAPVAQTFFVDEEVHCRSFFWVVGEFLEVCLGLRRGIANFSA